MTAAHDCRVAFAETLVALAEQDNRIVAVCNDSVGSSNLRAFKQRFPDRLINVGIAEQNLVGVSAGLASAGKIPFTCGASCFLTGRALEQVKADVAYSRHNVKLCGMSSGMVWLAVIAVLLSLVAAYYYLRIVKVMYFDEPADASPIVATQDMRVALSINGAAALVLGIVPQYLLALCANAMLKTLGG